MPYSSTADLPGAVRNSLPERAQRIFMNAYNSAEGGEETRARIAWGAVKNAGWRKRDGEWVKTDKRLVRSGAEIALSRLKLTVALAKWNPHQPRDNRGRWSAGGYGGGGGGSKLNAPHLGIGGAAARRVMGDEDAKVFTKPLTQSELTGKPAHLDNPHGFVVMYPDVATPPAGNGNPDDVAVFTHDADPGPGLNGVAFEPWQGPEAAEGWMKLPGGNFDEPPLPDAKGKRLGAGVIIEEPDGRVWTVAPTNRFGGYRDTLPKGGQEKGLDLRRTAMKEAWEESGLRVELTGYLGDFERTTSVARYYRAKRVGGDPTDYHWETQATKLLPPEALAEVLTHPADKPIVAALTGQSGPVVKMLEAGCRLWERLNPDDAADRIVAKAWTSSSGKWNKQPRVPSGFATGGRWTKGGYGSGAIGTMYGEAGAALDLQLIPNQKHPQAIKYNELIKQIEAEANAGQFSKATSNLWTEPQPKNTYKEKAWFAAKEAANYIAAKAANPQPVNAPKTPTPGAKAEGPTGTIGDPLKLSTFKKVGSKPGGSAEGAMYEDASGQKWLVKSYDTGLQAQNEVFAAKLYNALGAATPDMRLIDLEGAHKGGIGVASKWEDGLAKFDQSNPAHLKAVQAEFGVHALTANWDAIGLSYDNTMIRADGTPVMVDPGGAMLYRAQGTPKGALFGDTVTETSTMRGLNPNVSNPTAAAVFGPMDAQALADSYMHAVAAFDDIESSGNLDKMLKASFADAKVRAALQKKLGARTEDLEQQALELHANLESTKALSSATFGTETATLTHPDPAVTALANGWTSENIQNVADGHIGDLITQTYNLTGKSAAFYQNKIADLEKAAKAGNIEALTKGEKDGGLLYEPASTAAKSSANYGAYIKAMSAAQKAAKAHAALNLQKAPPAPDATAWISGATTKTAGDVKSAIAASKLDGGSWHDKVADSPNVTQKAPPPNQNPLPAMPDAPPANKLSNASTPNKGLVAKVAQVEAIVKSGAPDALAQVQAIAATLPAAPKQGYFKNAKSYMANVVAALGGETAMAAMDAQTKVSAAKKGLLKAADADAGKVSTPDVKLSVDAVAKPGHKVIAEENIGGFTLQTVESQIAFDPDNLQPPSDFNAHPQANGGPLSSKPEINAQNTAVSAKLYQAATTGDVAKVMAIEATPSKHVQDYKKTLIDELNAVGTKKVTKQLSGDGDPEKLLGAVSDTYKSVDFGAHGVKKQANYVLAGDAGPNMAEILHQTVWSKGKDVSLTTKAMKDFRAKSTANYQASKNGNLLKSFTGSAYKDWNTALRGYGSSSDLPQARKAGKAFQEAAVEIPAYSRFYRGISLNPGQGLTESALMAAKGKVLQDHGITSTSWDKPWGGGVLFRFVSAPGAKAIYAKDFSNVSSENEITLPPNYRMMIADVKKGSEITDKTVGVTNNTIVVDAILLPQDDAAI